MDEIIEILKNIFSSGGFMPRWICGQWSETLGWLYIMANIAIGLALLLGYRLKENFENPYGSTNVTEFWRKWHISLSTWLRDYVYIPLGGNRKGALNTYLFLLITMLVGGFWHGASWQFVCWGAAHGLALALHKAVHKYLPESKWMDFLGGIFTFSFVTFCWIFFRARDFDTALLMRLDMRRWEC